MNTRPQVIDIYHGNPFDAKSIRACGCAAVIHKALEGLTPDKTYHDRKSDCLANGLLFGAYWMPSSNNIDEQFKLLTEIEPNLGGKTLLCIDWEGASDGTLISETQLKYIVQLVQDHYGKPPCIYGGFTIRESRAAGTHDTQLAACPLWLQQYTSRFDELSDRDQPLHFPLATWQHFSLWQYGDGSGSYGEPSWSHISPGADFSVANMSTADLQAAWPNV